MKRHGAIFLRNLLLLAALLSVVLGCGYAFAPQGDYIDRSIRTIYVEPFGNKTAQAEAENLVRTAFIDQVIQNTRFRVVPELEQADAVVSGNILAINTLAISYRKSILAAEERMMITLETSLREKAGGKILWASRGVTGYVDYELQDDINLLPATRKRALTKLSRDTAEKALNLMMSNF
ncbi:MAG: LptE family protein [Smithellaceae bacterium]|nr:LptE family protein [Syntrophaceae bacterium]MDD4240593.1 LptE family protein [Smithellaceae bacterium]NLX53333.1 LptE family protein [Deltaproteobacteria bacterium]